MPHGQTENPPQERARRTEAGELRHTIGFPPHDEITEVFTELLTSSVASTD